MDKLEEIGEDIVYNMDLLRDLINLSSEKERQGMIFFSLCPLCGAPMSTLENNKSRMVQVCRGKTRHRIILDLFNPPEN